MSSGNTSKYLKYAVGEILLVVIGILIALQINNWNEKRQNKEKVDNLLSKIKKDIEADLDEIITICHFYNTKDSLIQLVLNNKLVKEDYQKPSSSDLHYIIFNRSQINLRNSGYENLMRVQDIIPEAYDDILEQLSNQYNDQFVYVQEAENNLAAKYAAFDDFLFTNYDWYSDQTPFFLNEERIDFLLNNIRYKGMAQQYSALAVFNYLRMNITYAYEALETYKLINEVLNIENTKPLFDFEPDKTIMGKYRTIVNEEFQLTASGYRHYAINEMDSIDTFQYAPNKHFMQGGFIRYERVADSINMYIHAYENGTKAYATKID